MERYYADPEAIYKAIGYLPTEKIKLILAFTEKAIQHAKAKDIPSDMWSIAESLGISNEVEKVIDCFTLTEEEYNHKVEEFERKFSK